MIFRGLKYQSTSINIEAAQAGADRPGARFQGSDFDPEEPLDEIDGFFRGDPGQDFQSPDPPGKKPSIHQFHQAALLGRSRVREP